MSEPDLAAALTAAASTVASGWSCFAADGLAARFTAAVVADATRAVPSMAAHARLAVAEVLVAREAARLGVDLQGTGGFETRAATVARVAALHGVPASACSLETFAATPGVSGGDVAAVLTAAAARVARDR